MTGNNLPSPEHEAPAYEILIDRPGPREAATGAFHALRAGASAATNLVAHLYFFGARAASNRKERFEDRLADRSAARTRARTAATPNRIAK